ncbi:MAG: ACT domain-containing protein [Planctomycetota bacterium]|nr:MAG: ACT domain-containing protein [Planctomycetota bacterium]
MSSSLARGSYTIRLHIPNQQGGLAKVTGAISARGGNIGAIDIVRVAEDHLVRDITFDGVTPEIAEALFAELATQPGVKVVNISDRVFLLHLGGKISMQSKIPLQARNDLSIAYTPGVAKICTAIHEDPERVYSLTIKRNSVAVVSDGTAVLGLGNIGPRAAMPVMEGKAQLFKAFADIDAWPICLDCHEVDEIVATVKAIAPGFGGINLEDIAAPQCFEIERRLREELDIPVFHDDQHGTAVVMIAGLINALRVVGKKPEEVRVVMAGVGAAGTACMDMMRDLGIREIIGCDRQGALYQGRENMNIEKQRFAELTNLNRVTGSLKEVLAGADVFVGLSGPGLLTASDLTTMAKDPIVFAMSNPVPEIMPEEAAPHVAVMATGRSDYPNQINNVLCFPGIFRGALDCRARTITEGMKMAAARAIADCISPAELCPEYVIPGVFDARVPQVVAAAVVAEAKANLHDD